MKKKTRQNILGSNGGGVKEMKVKGVMAWMREKSGCHVGVRLCTKD